MEKRYLMLKRFFILCMCLFFGFLVNSQTVKADLILDEWQIDGCHAIFFDQQPIREIHYNHKVVWRAGANITYVIDGDVSEVHFVPYDETTLSLTASKEGYEFIGWRADATASGDVLETDICTGEKTLYAVYKKTITAAFDGNGAGSGSVEKLSGTAYFNASGDIVNPSFKMPQNGFTKSGYAFSGWTHGSTGIVRTAGEDVTLTSDTTFSAKWQVAVQNFSYTGSVQSWTVPSTGYYKLEIWGASGGNAKGLGGGGNGGYTTGYVYLTSGQTLQICIGGKGYDNVGISVDDGGYEYPPGGYNGGGNAGHQGSEGYGGSGGGATHIALGSNRGVLSNYDSCKAEVLAVAGGGGGGAYARESSAAFWYLSGGSGGGLAGGAGESAENEAGEKLGHFYGSGGTQSLQTASDWTRARYGTFGQGGAQASHGAGGGGGWYGGGAGETASGGGGSGYIGGCLATLKYNGVTYTSSTTTSSNNGNGRAIITFLGN